MRLLLSICVSYTRATLRLIPSLQGFLLPLMGLVTWLHPSRVPPGESHWAESHRRMLPCFQRLLQQCPRHKLLHCLIPTALRLLYGEFLRQTFEVCSYPRTLVSCSFPWFSGLACCSQALPASPSGLTSIQHCSRARGRNGPHVCLSDSPALVAKLWTAAELWSRSASHGMDLHTRSELG